MSSTTGVVKRKRSVPKTLKREVVTDEAEARQKSRHGRSETLFRALDYIHIVSPVGLMLCFAGKCPVDMRIQWLMVAHQWRILSFPGTFLFAP